MIEWLRRKMIPTLDHGSLTYKEIWYMTGDPEPVLVNRKTTGFSPPQPLDRYEIHFTLAEKYSPKYEDRSYDKKYKLRKHGRTRFTHEEAVQHIEWMRSHHSYAHDCVVHIGLLP